MLFLKDHGLRIVPSDQFIVPENKPYLVASDHDHFHLQYDKYSATSAGCIIDHTRQSAKDSFDLMIRMLGNYKDSSERKGLLYPVYQLEPGEPMSVKLNSPGWEKVFRFAENEYPGSIIWVVGK